MAEFSEMLWGDDVRNSHHLLIYWQWRSWEFNRNSIESQQPASRHRSTCSSHASEVVIDFIETDFQPLKNALVDHCQKWQKKLTDLLNENARTEMSLRKTCLWMVWVRDPETSYWYPCWWWSFCPLLWMLPVPLPLSLLFAWKNSGTDSLSTLTPIRRPSIQKSRIWMRWKQE